MRTTVTEGITVAVVEVEERAEPAPDARQVVPPRRSTVETEAERVRRQQLVRRKAKLVRHALAASRTR